MNAAQFGVAHGNFDEALALFVRPFAIQQLVQRQTRRLVSAPQQPRCNGYTEQWVCTAHTHHRIKDDCDNNRNVEQQVALIMHMVGLNRDRTGFADNITLIGKQPDRRHNRNE